MEKYVKAILSARVYDVAVETPIHSAALLSARIGNEVCLKREDMQPVHSFKIRGAYNKMSQLAPAAARRGVIAASAGNHAQGVALAGRTLGIRTVIVMPVTTPKLKADAVHALGGQVVLHGDSYTDAYIPIVERRKAANWGERQREFQLYRRGRYVEFNLVHDKGTLFGLRTNGRIESILMSLPPKVQWRYDHQPEKGSREEVLLQVLAAPREWV